MAAVLAQCVLASLASASDLEALAAEYGWKQQFEDIQAASQAHRILDVRPHFLVVATPLPNGRYPEIEPDAGHSAFQITIVTRSSALVAMLDLDCAGSTFTLSDIEDTVHGPKLLAQVLNAPMDPELRFFCEDDFASERRAAEADVARVRERALIGLP